MKISLSPRTLLAGFVVLLTASAVGQATAPSWTLDSYITVPFRNILFLEQDSKGNVYGTTFNNSPNAENVSAFRLEDPTGPNPKTTVLDQVQAPNFRGYSGLAVADNGTVYLAVDLGEGTSSYIKKLNPDGKTDASFGNHGLLTKPGVRFQGLTLAGDKLLAAESWGRISSFDAATGREIGTSPAPAGTPPTIRDIDFVPSTQQVLGIDRDSVYAYSGGSPENPGSYQLAPLISGQGRQAAGQAIYYYPPSDRIYYTRTGLGRLGVATLKTGQPDVIENVGTPPGGPLSEPADAVISGDGNYLFVSDLRAPVIQRYRRGGAGSTIASASVPAVNATPANPPTVPGAALAPPPGPAPASTAPADEAALPALQGRAIAAGGLTPVVPQAAAGGASQTTAAAGGGEDGNSTTLPWEVIESVEAVKKRASVEGKTAAILFTNPEVALARRVEEQVFVQPGQLAKLPNVQWYRINTVRTPSAAQENLIFRVPTVLIFKPNADEAIRVSGDFSQQELLSALQR